LKELIHDVSEYGVCNVLMSDSRALYVHCSTHLAWITRCAPFGKASLIDDELEIDFNKETTPNDVVTILATRPLTDNEQWNIMEKGEFRVLKDGKTRRL
ncbi:MAG: class II glutamine amidotransferase, partial [Magnetovibrio sp.]|nr:class II glutamine amidotransferase [Magnetovibrio sp.]